MVRGFVCNLEKFVALVMLSLVLLISAMSSPSHAADLNWSGLYRIEGISVMNSRLDDTRREKSYLMHHLILNPKIIAADGLNIYARFDALNSASTFYPNNQMGEFFGQAPDGASGCAAGNNNCGALNRTQPAGAFVVNELYLHWVNEFGALVAGRMPVQFGLGMTHNAGRGVFDHWFDSKDLVGFKMQAGNIMIFPMYGKIREGELDREDDVQDTMIHFQYDNPETELSLGVMYESRYSTKFGNAGVPTGTSGFGGASSTWAEGWGGKQLNIFVGKQYPSLSVGVEAGFVSGQTGAKTSGGTEVAMDAYGIAGELAYNADKGPTTWRLKAGIASGDNLDTPEKYEGYFFDRNYEVGMLLFNYYLGTNGFDAMGGAGWNAGTTATGGMESMPDVESVGNALYVAPSYESNLSDKWSWRTSLVWATLAVTRGTNTITGLSKELGYEWDLGFQYKPYDRFQIRFDGAMFSPGAAFSGGNLGLQKATSYGIMTKAAVSF